MFFSRRQQSNTDMKLIVGLGNPGSEYEGTRHNIGFEVVDRIAESLGVKVKNNKFGARFGETEFENKKLILLKPQQYMNRSGQVVSTASGFYKLAMTDLLIVTDDMALEPGRIRLRAKGSAGGHNGLKDIIAKIGTEEFSRLRIGIGQPEYTEAYDYVLSKIPRDQKDVITDAIEKAKDACFCWLRNSIESAMNEYNNNSG